MEGGLTMGHEHMEILVYMTDSGSNLPWVHVLACLKKKSAFPGSAVYEFTSTPIRC